jgi:hypothetical protein
MIADFIFWVKKSLNALQTFHPINRNYYLIYDSLQVAAITEFRYRPLLEDFTKSWVCSGQDGSALWRPNRRELFGQDYQRDKAHGNIQSGRPKPRQGEETSVMRF